MAAHAEVASDPAAAFDLTAAIIAAKVFAERTGANWYVESTPALPTLLAHTRAADAWLAPDGSGVSLPPLSETFARAALRLFAGRTISGTATALGVDVLGDAYQAIVGATFRGELGAYFTPDDVATFIAKMLDVRAGSVGDPASGTGSLLLALQRHATVPGLRLLGNDLNPRMVRAARLNFALHGLDAGNISQGDGLELGRLTLAWQGPRLEAATDAWLSDPDREGWLDAAVANPPFAGHERNPETLRALASVRAAPTNVSSLPRTLPFIELVLATLRFEGVAGLVIPTSVLNAEAPAFRRLRRVLLDRAEIMAIVGLPEAAFTHTDCGIHGALLFLRRTRSPRTDYPVFIDWIDRTGYDTMGRSVGDSDFESVLARFRTQDAHPQHLYSLSQLQAWDRFDPNWIRSARDHSLKELATTPLTDVFRVREARIRRSELEDAREYQFFEVGDADLLSGAIRSNTATGAYLKKKSRLKVRVHSGDILLPNHRDSLIAKGAPTGRSAVIVGPEFDGAITSDRFIVLRTELPARAAREVLNAAGVRRQLVAQCRGAASLDVREKALGAVRVPCSILEPAAIHAMTALADEACDLRRTTEAVEDRIRVHLLRAFGSDTSDFRPQSHRAMRGPEAFTP